MSLDRHTRKGQCNALLLETLSKLLVTCMLGILAHRHDTGRDSVAAARAAIPELHAQKLLWLASS